MKVYDGLIDKLTAFFTGERYAADIALAKREFFEDAGVVDELNPNFDMRMTQFLEWYLFSRGLTGVQLPPAQYSLQIRDYEILEEERPFYERLANTRHSLFEFLKVRGSDVHIRDLYRGEKIVIHDCPIKMGFNRDEIFEARLIPDGKEFLFTKAFCFHPVEATKFIETEVQKAKKGDPAEFEPMILRLMKMKYKYDQYRHLRLEYVYSNEKRVRF